MNKPTGGPAFPQMDGNPRHFQGLSVREVFAAHALTGLAEQIGWKSDDTTWDDVAKAAYKAADAMMRNRYE